MLLCTSVPNLNLTATLLLSLVSPGASDGLAEKMRERLYPVPKYTEAPQFPSDPGKAYRESIKRMELKLQQLEAAPGDNSYDIANAKVILEYLRKELAKAEAPRKMGSGSMPLLGWDDLDGKMPKPRKPLVRD